MSGSLTNYRFITELGRGGMGTANLAVVRGPARFRKLVVVKRLNPGYAADPAFTAMFLEEARLAARLQHPNIVQTNEVFSDPDDGYCIVMEYVEGVSLRVLIRRMRSRPDALAHADRIQGLYVRAIVEVLEALQYAHSLSDFEGKPLNIVHRDVNPANVVLGYDGQVKLLDFGIAKAADTSKQTQTGVLKGKLHYMSPESMTGEPVDARTDLFAAGAMLWDALVGARLWEGLKGVDIGKALLRGSIPTPSSCNPDVPADLEAVCMRALARNPAERYPDAASFAAEIARAYGDRLLSAVDLGAAVSSEFRLERESLRAQIVEHVQAETNPDGEAVPIEGAESSERAVRSKAEADTVVLPGSPAQIEAAPVSVRVSPSAAVETPRVPRRPETRASFPPPARPRWRRFLGRNAGAVAALAVAFIAFASVSTAMRAPQEPAHPASASTSASIAGPAAPGPFVWEPRPRVELDPSGGAIPPPLDDAPRVDRVEEKPRPARHHAALPLARAIDPASARRHTDADVAGSDRGAATLASAPPNLDRGPASGEAPLAGNALGPSAPLSAASPAPTVAAISPGVRRAVFEAHREQLQACWRRTLMEQPFLTARVRIDVSVAADGHVTDVGTSSAKDGTARFQACLRDAVRDWVFPPAANAGRVSNTLVFE